MPAELMSDESLLLGLLMLVSVYVLGAGLWRERERSVFIFIRAIIPSGEL